MLNAAGKPEADRNSLRWQFRVATAREMKSLGAAFGRAVLPHVPAHGAVLGMNLILGSDGRTLRVGLGSANQSGVGKSTFVKGLLATAGKMKSLERVWFDDYNQHVWFSPESGWIRHYDCNIGNPNMMLPSYRRNDKSKFAAPLTDIVEHPYNDMHDTMFDCIVDFSRPDKQSPLRLVTVRATPELAATPAFQDFLRESADLRENSSAPVTARNSPAAAPT